MTAAILAEDLHQTFGEVVALDGPPSMPGLLRAFAAVNPVTLVVDAVRALTIGHAPVLTSALGAVAWLAGLLVVFVPLSVRAFRSAL